MTLEMTLAACFEWRDRFLNFFYGRFEVQLERENNLRMFHCVSSQACKSTLLARRELLLEVCLRKCGRILEADRRPLRIELATLVFNEV